MSGSSDAGAESDGEAGLSPNLIALAVGAVDVPVFAYVGLVLFGEAAFGAAVGLVIGLGMYLFLPAVIADDQASADDGDEFEPIAPSERVRTFHRTAAGLALPPAGILLLTWRFVSDSLLIGVLVTLVLTTVIYLSLAVLLPRRLS
ncbi:hypothetical protein [Natrinema salifodinae]|uniref:Uncharacterized protein n=1 Tax=Natrinema salifodinae TaxID=1202768 RepID=A0A1I0Q9I9_9EURY|nr:hypothetical protein [Natrinema salifodinae]SEW23537.1 hypothetical protein SAMN05216285_3259 [Natrinema salifodinae]